MTVPAVPDSAAQDPRVRDAYVNLLLTAIRQAQDILQTGIPQVRGPMVTRLLTIAAKAMKDSSESEEMVRLRRELEQFYASMRDAL